MDTNPTGGPPWWAGFGIAWELGYTIAIPIVLLALGGRLLDRVLGTSPLFLLVGIPLAILVSSIAVAKKARELLERGEHHDKGQHSG